MSTPSLSSTLESQNTAFVSLPSPPPTAYSSSTTLVYSPVSLSGASTPTLFSKSPLAPALALPAKTVPKHVAQHPFLQSIKHDEVKGGDVDAETQIWTAQRLISDKNKNGTQLVWTVA